jgi:hypothetical protein
VAGASAQKASQRSDPVLTSDYVVHLQPAVRRPTPLQRGEADDLLARLRTLDDGTLAALLDRLLAERPEGEARDLIEALAARRGLTVSFEPR